MKRFLSLLIIGLLVFVGQAAVEGIQFVEVKGFSGGLVNSVANALMRDDQSLDLVNYDVENGDLRRRSGLTKHYNDADTGNLYAALFTYFHGITKKTFTIRKEHRVFGDARDSLYILTVCNDATEKCTTLVYDTYFPFYRNSKYPFNIHSTYMNDAVILSGTQSEPLLFDGTKFIPLKARTLRQPNAVGLVGGGNINGTVRYKYAFRNSGNALTNMSAPTWPITVKDGKVVLYGIGPAVDSTVHVKAWIYREKNFDQKWELLDSIQLRQTTSVAYLDNKANTVDADTTAFPWGPLKRNSPTQSNRQTPGYFNVSLAAVATAGYGMGIKACCQGFPCTTLVGYAIAAVDSFGGESMISPPVWTIIATDTAASCGNPDTMTWKLKATISNWPMPADSGIKTYKLLRSYACLGNVASPPSSCCGLFTTGPIFYDTVPNVTSWYTIQGFKPSETSVKDSLRPRALNFDLYCAGVDIDDSIFGDTDVVMEQYAYGEQPESTCYSGSALLRPSLITEHGFRLYAIDDNTAPNTIFYSEFASPTIWPIDKRLNIPSRSGDWLTGLLSVDNNNLFGARQNSSILMSGHSFFQFTVADVIEEIGMVAPRSLSYGRNRGAFVSKDGIFLFDRSGSVLQPAISLPIQNAVDSCDTNLIRGFARFVEDELWVSLPNGATKNNRLFILDTEPTPMWKTYDFGVLDMVEMDYDTTLQTYLPHKWLLIKNNDSLYRWGYKDTLFDPGDTIIAKYQSKYFFDDGIREKIFFVDIFGEGTGDSLFVTLRQNFGTVSTTRRIKLDFSKGEVNRAKFNIICDNASVAWVDNGLGNYKITGFRIGMAQWDEGSNR